jgi:hypothetical protein
VRRRLLRWGAGLSAERSQPPWQGVARPGPVRLTSLEVVCGAARVGSGFLDRRHGVRGIIGTSLGGVWRLSRSLLITVVVVVGLVDLNGGVGTVLRKLGRLWWTSVADGRGSWSELLDVIWWLWFKLRRWDGGRCWVKLPSPFPFDGSCRC